MLSTTVRRSAVALTTGTLLVSSLLVPATAQATAALHCTARMSIPRPKQESTTVVYVHTTAAAAITTTAYYKTTHTSHSAKANRYGNASIPYRISRATKGKAVKVSVRVTKGRSVGTCTTSFTPR